MNIFSQQINALLEESKEHPVLEKQGQFLYINAQSHLLAMSAEVYELKVEDQYKDYEITVEVTQPVAHVCTCGITGICEHKVAAFLRIKEELNRTDAPAPSSGYAYTREGMRKRVLAERVQKAKSANFTVQLAENVFGEHLLRSGSGQEYSLTLHSFKDKKGYCSCPDYQHNKLGTCKHLMFTFDYLKKNEASFRRKKHFFPFIEIFLDPLHNYKISYFYPHQLDLFSKSLIDKYFKGKEFVEDEDVADLLGFFEEAPQHKQFRIRPEVLRKVESIFNEQTLIRLEETTDFTTMFRADFPKVSLFDYQLEGAGFACFREAAIIADEMGLGKTKQAIASAFMKMKLFQFKRTLVICPVSLKAQWANEIDSFRKGQVALVDGNPLQRNKVYSEFSQPFLVAGYETVVRDFDAINQLQFDYIILDEAQRIRDYESKTATSIKRLQRKHALVITGTPIENRLVDIYSIVDFLDKKLLAPLWEFSYKYCYFESHSSNKVTGYHNLEGLRERLAHVMIRRERRQVLQQLPQVQEYDVPVELFPEQYLQQYDLAAQLQDILQKSYLTPFDHQRIYQLIHKMRMVANSTFLLDNASNLSRKMDELEHILLDKLNLRARKHKVVIFSEWKKMASIIAFALRRKGMHVVELNGDVPSSKRAELIDDFEKKPNTKIFVTTGTGSVGLNLQMADTVINFEIPHSQSEKSQRTGRIARLGQRNKQLTVMNLVGENSIEIFMKEQTQARNSLFDNLLEDGSSDNKPIFTDNAIGRLKQHVEHLLTIRPSADEAEGKEQAIEIFEKGIGFFEEIYRYYSGSDLPTKPTVQIKDGEVFLRFPLK